MATLKEEEKSLITAATKAVQDVPRDALGNVNDDHNVGAAVSGSVFQPSRL